MTPVKLTELERLEIRNSSNMQNIYTGKIMDQSAYLLGVTSGDVSWARHRHWSAEIKATPSFLISDSTLMINFEFNMLSRDFDFKDTDTVGTLDDQVLSFLNADNRWSYLVNDYFDNKGASLII